MNNESLNLNLQIQVFELTMQRFQQYPPSEQTFGQYKISNNQYLSMLTGIKSSKQEVQDCPPHKNQFRLTKSKEHSHEAVSLAQLQKLHQIVALQLEMKISSISNILQIKIKNKQKQALDLIKAADNSQKGQFYLQKSIQKMMNQMVKKLTELVRNRTIRYSCHFFTILHTNKFLTTKNQSKGTTFIESHNHRNISRINSKAEKDYEENQWIERNLSSEVMTLNSQKKQRNIKKKLGNADKNLNVNEFCSQLDELLSIHENYLSKK